jgi:transposase InsO family protein
VPGQITTHSDRGPPMIAKPVAHLLAGLGVTKSHSRPQADWPPALVHHSCRARQLATDPTGAPGRIR